MRRPHIRRHRLAIAVAVTTAATLTAGVAGSASATPPASPVAASSTTPALQKAVDAAREAAYAHASATGVSKKDTLEATDTLVDPDGKQHVRFVRTHRGMPVLGGDLVVHLTAKSAYEGVTRAFHHQVDVTGGDAKLSAREARTKAAAVAKGRASDAELVVDARNGRTTLAYQVQVADSGTAESGGARTVVLDAASGTVLSNVQADDSFLSPALQRKLRARGERLNPATGLFTPAPPATGKAAKAAGFPAAAKGTGASFFVGSVPLSTTQTAKKSFTLKDSTRGNTETRDSKRQGTGQVQQRQGVHQHHQPLGQRHHEQPGHRRRRRPVRHRQHPGLLQEDLRPQGHQERRPRGARPGALRQEGRQRLLVPQLRLHALRRR